MLMPAVCEPLRFPTGTARLSPRPGRNLISSLTERSSQSRGFTSSSEQTFDTGTPHAYIGEAEELRSRLKGHKGKEFWISAIVFLSKDENLTKAHIRYLEGRLIEKAKLAARHTLENDKDSGSKLPESDIQDMEVFLEKVEQLLPVLGTDILVPIPTKKTASPKTDVLTFKVKDAAATGQRTETGFVVFRDSTGNGGGTKVRRTVPLLRAQIEKPSRRRGRTGPEGACLRIHKRS